MISLTQHLNLLVKATPAGPAVPSGLDPFSSAMEGLTQSVNTAVYLAVGQVGLAVLVATLCLFSWRKLASLWDDWNTAATLIAKITLVMGLGASAAWGYHQYEVAGHVPDMVLAAVCAAGFFAAWWVAQKTGLTFVKPRERVTKGSVEATVEEVSKLVRRDGPSRITLAGVPIPRKSEAVHFMMLGGTGAGKSVAIGQLLERIYQDGDTIIMVDSGGDFASKYYDAGRDYILNPFDERTVSWNLMAEMEGPYDAEALSKSIIPEGVGDSKEWNSYAQTFLGSCLTVLKARTGSTINDLLYFAQQASIDELREHLRGTPAYSQLESDKMFASIRVIVNNYLSPYTYLRGDANADFSIRRFVQAEKPGALFVTYRDDQLETLRNLVSCVLDVAARTILSLTPDDNRRVWLIIDEFASIGKVQSVEAFATKARKAGGCLVVGLQSIAQMKDKYGEHQAQSILSCLGTWLVLRCADTDTADYMSRYLGEQTVVRHTEGSSEGKGGGSKSVSEQVSTQRTILASELQELAPLNGYMRVAGGFPICRVLLSYKNNRKASKPAFVAKDYSKAAVRTAAPMVTRPASSFQPVGSGEVGALALIEEGAGSPAPSSEASADFYRTLSGQSTAAFEAKVAQESGAPQEEISLPDATDRYIQELLATLNDAD